jgi:hypothetical protein
MRVRCLADHLSDPQLAALGRPPYRGGLAWGLTIGEEYLVLGLSFAVNPKQPLTGPYVFLLLQRDNVLNVGGYDLGLFTITDPHPSQYWEVRAWQFSENQIVDLLPPTLAAVLYAPTAAGSDGSVEDDAWFAYLDSEGFRQLCDRLRGESDIHNTGE